MRVGQIIFPTMFRAAKLSLKQSCEFNQECQRVGGKCRLLIVRCSDKELLGKKNASNER